jgi:hypothetical protein
MAVKPVTITMNAITQYQQRPDTMRPDLTNTFNILMLTFFFAYMGYKLLIDYTKTQSRTEDRMKTLEDHMETIEENATFINNEIANSSEQIKELQREVREMREDLKCICVHILSAPYGIQGPDVHEFYKYVKTNVFPEINDRNILTKMKSGERNL